MDNNLDPQLLDQLNQLPSWARDEAIRKLRGEDTRTFTDKLLGNAVSGIGKGFEILDKAPIAGAPAGNLNYLANLLRGQNPEQASSGQGIRAEDPKKFVGKQIEQVPVVGGVAKGATDALLDPATIVGAGIVGPGVLAGLGGRGAMGLGEYIGLNLAGGAGAVAASKGAEAVGNPNVNPFALLGDSASINLNTPAAIAGGFLGASGAGMLSQAKVEGAQAIRNTGEAVAGQGNSLKNRSFDLATELKSPDPFQIYPVAKNAQGQDGYIVDRESLNQRIVGRRAAAFGTHPDGTPYVPAENLNDWNINTDHMEAMKNAMEDRGLTDAHMVNPWQSSHTLGNMKESEGQVGQLMVAANQANLEHKAFSTAVAASPDLRFSVSELNGYQHIRGEIPPEVDAQLAQHNALKAQLGDSQKALVESKAQVDAAKAARDTHWKDLRSTIPSGSRPIADDLRSGFISGNQDSISNAISRFQNKGIDPTPFMPAIQEAAANHQSFKQVEADHAALTQFHADLQNQIKQTGMTAEELLKPVMKNANSMKDKLFRKDGSEQLYRMGNKGVVIQDGKVMANLEPVAGRSSVGEAIQSNATLQAEDAAQISEAKGKLDELRAARKAARLTGDKATADDLKSQLQEAAANVDRLSTPSRPIPKEMLPPVAGRQIVPLTELANYKVLTPGRFDPAILAQAGVKDGRTMSLLNDHARISSSIDYISNKIKQNELDAASLKAKIQPTQNEQVLLQQGVIDGVRPEIVQGLQQVNNLGQQAEGLKASLADAQIEFSGVTTRISHSQQALEATLQKSEANRDMINQKLLEARARYDEQRALFDASLSLGDPHSVAEHQLNRFDDTHQAIMDRIEGKLSSKRLTEAAFQNQMDAAARMTEPRKLELTSALAKEHNDWVERYAGSLSDMGTASAIRRSAAPHQTSEFALDPMASRGKIGGWFRKTLMGTGLDSPVAEGWMAETLNNRTRAINDAWMGYEANRRSVAELADMHLGTLAGGTDTEAAWARTLRDEKDPQKRLQQYLAHAVKPMESPEWQKAFGVAKDIATPEELRQMYDLSSDEFATLTTHNNLVDWKKTSQDFGMGARNWGKKVNEIRDLAGGRKIVPSMVKPEFRTELTGSIQPIPGSGGEITRIPEKDRNMFTDMLEIKRNELYKNRNNGGWRAMHNDVGQISDQSPLALSDMFAPKEHWPLTLAANTLNSVYSDSNWEALKPFLKDPAQVAKLKAGSDISANEWKNPKVASSWPKMKGILHEDAPSGVWKGIDNLNKGMQMLASSIIFGDLGYAGNQALTAFSISPAEPSRIVAHAKAGSLTDHGFLMAMENRRDLVQHLSDMGINFFQSGVRDTSQGNLWERVPGLRVLGKQGAKLDTLTFQRLQPLVFMDTYDATLAQLRAVKGFGKTPYTEELIDGIPGLSSIHSKQDIWQSTDQDLEKAVLRNLENQMGNIRPSSLLLGADRKKLEGMLLFVPGYFRAKAGVFTQATRVLRDPNSPEGWLAASLLAREAAFRIGFGATVAAATGQFDGYMKDINDMSAFDPRNSGGMLAGPLGDGGHLGLSWGNAAPKLYAQMLLGNKAGTANLNPKDRLTSIQNFFDGRTNPVIRGMVEQYEGKDFIGNPVKSPTERAVAMFQNVAPIWMGAGLQTGADEMAKDHTINPLAIAANSGAQFVNLNYRDNTPYDVLNNRFKAWQGQKFPGQPQADYANANGDLRRMAEQGDPEVAKAQRDFLYYKNRRAGSKEEQVNSAFNSFDKSNSDYDQQVAEATARVQAGQMNLAQWKDNYGNVQQNRATSAKDLRQILGDSGLDLDKLSKNKAEMLGGKAPDVALALAEYRSVKPQDYLKSNPDGTPITRFTDAGPVLDQDIDWTRYQRAKDATLAKYSPNVQSEIKTWLEPDDPIAKQLTHARASMDTYFQEVPKYQGLTVDQGNHIDMFMSGMRAFAGQLQDAGAKVDPQAAYGFALKQMAQAGYIKTPEEVKLAMMAQNMLSNSKLQLAARNPASIQFLLDNPDMIRFYPWLKSELPSKLDPLLPSDLRKTADYNAIASRELRQ